MRRILVIATVALLATAAATSATTGVASCRTHEVRQHDEAVFGHFATLAATRSIIRSARRANFSGIKVENDGCGDFEVEIDGADTQQQRSSFSAEAQRAGFEVTFEQTGEPMQPPAGQVVGVLGRKRTIAQANALALRLATANFRYIDIVPSGTSWLVVMPQVPVKNALSIAKEVAKAGFHVQFRNS